MKQNEGDESPKKKGFHLRMPPELRQRIDELRKRSGKSINQEVVDRLQASVNNEPPELLKVIRDLQVSVDRLTRRLEEIEK